MLRRESQEQEFLPQENEYHASSDPTRFETLRVDSPLLIPFATSIIGGKVLTTTPWGSSLEVPVPIAIGSGESIEVLTRRSDGSARRDKPILLTFFAEVQPHPYYRREGFDLVLELPVSIPEAVDGAHVRIPTPDGWIRIPIPPSSQGGERLLIKGKGIKTPNGSRGDLYIQLSIRLPQESAQARGALARIASLYQVSPRVDLRF